MEPSSHLIKEPLRDTRARACRLSPPRENLLEFDIVNNESTNHNFFVFVMPSVKQRDKNTIHLISMLYCDCNPHLFDFHIVK